MNKKMIFLFGWLTNVFLLLLIIVIPKISELYSMLYLLTMFMIFVVPLFLIVFQGCLTINNKQEVDMYNAIPNVGCALVIMLTFVKFISSIEDQGKPQIITILLLFVILELLLGYMKFEYKKMTKKQFVFIEIASYVSLVLFFFCAMVISFDYGII